LPPPHAACKSKSSRKPQAYEYLHLCFFDLRTTAIPIIPSEIHATLSNPLRGGLIDRVNIAAAGAVTVSVEVVGFAPGVTDT
jgi:hypothetical protein